MVSHRIAAALRERRGYLLVAVTFVSVIILFWGCGKESLVIIESEPSGANVSVGGKPVGQTPLEVRISTVPQRIKVDFVATEAATEVFAPIQKTLKKLTAAYLPLTANLPLFVALDQGYFEKHGITVKAIEATSPNDIVTGLVAGKVDFAAVLAYSIIFPAAIRYPGQFKLFSSSEETIDHFTSSIIVKKDSPIKTYQDLRGKRIGVYTGLVQINFLKAILAGMGIAPDEVDIIEISPRLQIQGLISDQYDALSSTEPTVNIAQIQGLARAVERNPRTRFIMCPFPSTAACLSTRLLEENPEAANGVVEALNMAIDFINSHPEQAKRSLPKYTPIPKQDEEKVLADLKLFKYCKLGEENRLNVQRFADFLFEKRILRERIDDVNKLFGDYAMVCGM